MAWSDEFDGNSLDLTKWEYRLPGVRLGGTNVPGAVTVGGGSLVITTTFNRELNRFETGMIGTQTFFQQTYGYFEARIKLQTQSGHWSAFWLQSPEIQTVSDPPDPAGRGTEIDIMEYRSHLSNGVQHALHWNGYKTGSKSKTFQATPEGFAGREWYTFGFLWTRDGYTFFIDGAQTWQTSAAVSQVPQYLVLSLEVGDPAKDPLISWVGGLLDPAHLPDSLKVDYVRVYSLQETAPVKPEVPTALEKAHE